MKDLSLIQKLFRRKRYFKAAADGFDRTDKADKTEELIADSPKVLKLLRGLQRRLDRKFGREFLAQEPALSERLEATLERVDFGISDFGVKATFSAGAIAAVGMQPGDIIRILEGDLKGYELEVVSIESSTELRLEDVATYTGPDSNITVRANMSAVKASYK